MRALDVRAVGSLHHTKVGTYDTQTLIGALDQLRRALGGQKATLLWDGLPAHRSKAMAAWLRRQRSWLVVQRLPSYAPELNPVEALWANLRRSSWPTWPPIPSPRSPPQPSVVSNASAIATGWPTRSCGTAACPSGEPDHLLEWRSPKRLP
jgi:DDE superfamily endonuclease